jgi:hypothetical protein
MIVKRFAQHGVRTVVAEKTQGQHGCATCHSVAALGQAFQRANRISRRDVRGESVRVLIDQISLVNLVQQRSAGAVIHRRRVSGEPWERRAVCLTHGPDIR